MRKQIFILALSLARTLYQIQAQSIRDLDFLIGKWELKEIVHEGSSDEYIERGARECRYVLDDTYIRCESRATRKGKKRSYISNINYNKGTGRFFMTSQFSDYDFRSNTDILIDTLSKELRLIPHTNIDDGEFFQSRIDFRNRNKLIWEGWSSPFVGNRAWKLVYREEMIRKE